MISFQKLVSKWIKKFYSENKAYEHFLTLPQTSDILALAILAKIKNESKKVTSLLELGAGDGDLSYSILKHSEKFRINIERIILVEESEIRKESIRKKFGEENIEILDNIFDFNGKVDILIANEFFDSLPFSVIMYDGKFKELFSENGNFFFSEITQKSLEYIKKYILDKICLRTEIVFEICDLFPEYISKISQASKIAIISDYGYRYFQHRTPYGSVVIHRKYKTEKMDFFNLQNLKNQVSQNFGKSDISFFVDFDILESIFEINNFSVDVKRISSFLIENLEGNEAIFSSQILQTIDALCNWGNFFILTAHKK